MHLHIVFASHMAVQLRKPVKKLLVLHQWAGKNSLNLLAEFIQFGLSG